ncbi:FkbM family methyltransferase [Bradyrhizobium sp. USDA 4449]
MRSFLKKILWVGTAWWPLPLKAAVANSFFRDETFVRAYGPDLIARLAPIFGIDGVRAKGQYGEILSSPSDRTVFAAYASTGTWAQSTNAIFSKFFTESGGGTYLDIGANIGLTTIPIARLPNVNCIAFEPAPENFRNLQVNVRANCDQTKVKTLQLALFERESELDFELSNYNLGDHRIRMTGSDGRAQGEGREVIRVQAVPLDSLRVVNSDRPVGIKIDTQGAEPFVIGGGKETLSRAQLLVMEWCPYMMTKMGGDPQVVLQFLRKSFRSARVTQAESGDGPDQFLPINEVCDLLAQTIDKYKQDEKYYVDIIATK